MQATEQTCQLRQPSRDYLERKSRSFPNAASLYVFSKALIQCQDHHCKVSQSYRGETPASLTLPLRLHGHWFHTSTRGSTVFLWGHISHMTLCFCPLIAVYNELQGGEYQNWMRKNAELMRDLFPGLHIGIQSNCYIAGKSHLWVSSLSTVFCFCRPYSVMLLVQEVIPN